MITVLMNGGARDVYTYVLSEEGIDLVALFKVLNGFEAADFLEEIELALGVYAGVDISVPVNVLELDIGVVLLDGEVERLVEVDAGWLDDFHELESHLELVEVEGFVEVRRTFIFTITIS